MTLFEILCCVLIISASAFLSSSEIALLSLSRFQLRSLKERLRSAHRKIKKLLSDPGGLLISILVLNEGLNIALSTVIARVVSREWGSIDPSQALWFQKIAAGREIPVWMLQALVGTLLTVPIVLLFCEITPKVVAARANQLVATLSAGPMGAIYTAMKPIRILVGAFMSLVTPRKQSAADAAHTPGSSSLLREEEFMSMIEEGHKEGNIQESEMELIRNVFEMDNTTVADVMVPLEKVLTLPMTTPLRSAINSMPARRFSRIPVVAQGGPVRSKIVGVLYSKDLLLARLENDAETLDSTIAEQMRKPLAVVESVRLNGVFLRMKKQKMHMAIVESNTGEALGIVTMNDVLEALFEDILPDFEDMK